MFSMDIANPGNQQMIFRDNQSPTQQSASAVAAAAAAAAQQQQQQQHQQIFPSQYGYQQQQAPQHIQQTQQQQQPSTAHYYTAYTNSSSGVANTKGHMNFVATSPSVYMQSASQQQQQQQQPPPPPQQQQQQSPPQQQQNMFAYSYGHQTTQMGLPYVQNAVRYQGGGHHSPNNSSTSNNTNNNNNNNSVSHSNSSISRHNNISINSNNNSSANTPIYGGGGGGMRYGGGRGRGGYMPHNFLHFHRQVHNNYYYNQQHHFSSNNAVPEKTPTLRIVHPNTKKILNIKLNRIYNTMADLRPQLQSLHQAANSNIHAGGAAGTAAPAAGAAAASASAAASGEKLPTLLLCLDFLSLRGCMHGSGCDRVHVAGLEYMWDTIEPTTTRLDDGTVAYETGFRVHCYDPSLTRYYNIPSECVKMSKGSQDYIAMFNDHGDNFKTKFKLCADMTNTGACDKGEECTDIHCSLKDFESVRDSNTNATHLNDAELMRGVPRLPADMTVRVFDQNSLDTFHDYSGGSVLMTEGAKAYAKSYEQEMNNIPSRKRMQHCAHFRLKDLCRLGETCRFLHVLPTPEEMAQRKEADAAKALREEQQRQQQQQQTQQQQRHTSISGAGSGSSNSSSTHNPYA